MELSLNDGRMNTNGAHTMCVQTHKLFNLCTNIIVDVANYMQLSTPDVTGVMPHVSKPASCCLDFMHASGESTTQANCITDVSKILFVLNKHTQKNMINKFIFATCVGAYTGGGTCLTVHTFKLNISLYLARKNGCEHIPIVPNSVHKMANRIDNFTLVFPPNPLQRGDGLAD